MSHEIFEIKITTRINCKLDKRFIFTLLKKWIFNIQLLSNGCFCNVSTKINESFIFPAPCLKLLCIFTQQAIFHYQERYAIWTMLLFTHSKSICVIRTEEKVISLAIIGPSLRASPRRHCQVGLLWQPSLYASLAWFVTVNWSLPHRYKPEEFIW